MPVNVRLPAALRSHAGGQARVVAQGTTIGEVVDDLVRQFPTVVSHLKSSDGELHRFVNVYVDDEDVRFLDGLATPVRDGAEVSIVPAVAGGLR